MTDEIVNADLAHGISLLVRRPGVEKPFEIVVEPEHLLGKPTIGVGSSAELRLFKERNELPFHPGSAAAEAKGPLLPGDRIEQINGQAIRSYGQLQDFLAAHAADDLTVTVARTKEDGGAHPEDLEKVQIRVPKNPMRQFGLGMALGPIAAVRQRSPAVEAGLQRGDLLRAIDGKPVADPMRLPYELRQRAGTEILLEVERGGKPLRMKVKLSSSSEYAPSDLPDSPVAIPELGAAYYVLNTVARVEPGSSAAVAGVQAGDQVTSVKVAPPSDEQMATLKKKYPAGDPEQFAVAATLPMADDERNWPYFLTLLQGTLPDTTVELTWQRGGKEMTGKLAPAAAKDWFDSQRGWILEPTKFVQRAGTFSQAARWGGRETLDATLLVYRTLHSVVGTKQISVRNFGGPKTIILVALMQARQGLGNLLIFLTLFGANLAVINFLPIPLLDGGHMVLLIYEGIRGKPADERVLEILTWIGLIFILGLMIFVLGLDFGWIARPGAH